MTYITLFVVALALPFSVRAQDHQVRAQPTRLTVQSGQAGVITTSIYVIVNTNETINLAVGTTPANVTSAVLDTTVFTAPAGNQLFSSAVLTVNYDGTVPQTGVNEIEINSSGDYTYRLPVPINSAIVWAGDPTNNAFAANGNWGGGSAPTGGDIVVFGSDGAAPVFDDDDDSPSFFTNAVTNVVITMDQPVGGLRFSHGDEDDGDPDDDVRYNVEIQSGASLSVTGAAGFYLLQDTINLPGQMVVEFSGGGTLLVSNETANIAMLKEIYSSTLNMEELDTFVADVDQIGLGTYLLYPNYFTNGYEVDGVASTATNAEPQRFIVNVQLAKTNVIKAVHVDPNDYNHPTIREYPLTIGHNRDQGTTGDSLLYFGISNAFYMDAICFGQFEADLANNLQFNPDTNVIFTNITPTIIFRNSDGVSPMTALVCGDGVSEGPGGNAVRGHLDLDGGTVDVLVDRLYLGRDRLEGKSRSPSIGQMTISDGLVVANMAYLGYQQMTNNLDDSGGGGNETCYAEGTMTVNDTAVLEVRDTMHLGYTTAAATNIYRGAQDAFGLLQVNDGGLARINRIVIGGGSEPDATLLSVDNRIQITGGGELIVTNRIGQTNKWLNELSMADSILTLHVDGSQAAPYVYATNVVTSGVGNTLNIAVLTGVSSFPTQLPLIAYSVASPNFGVTLPSGFYGYIVNNTVDMTIDVVILDTPPANLVWDGTPGTTWDTSAANWQGSLVFANGDTARFDDTATTPSVDIPGTVFIGGSGVLVTNSSLAYSIDGAGTIGGTSPMNKWGTGSLAVNVASGLPLNVHEGMVTGSGAIGSTSVSSNGTLSFSGAVTRLNSSGSATILAGGSVANGAVVSGGSLTNAGTINGELDVTGSNTLAELSASGIVTLSVEGTSEIGEGVILDLDGIWNNGVLSGPAETYRISVSGTMTGTGSIKTGSPDISHATGDAPDYWSRLVIGSGGVLSPGSAPGELWVFSTESQVDFSPGATIVLDVDMDSADGSNPRANAPTGSTAAKNSDVILTSRWSTRTGTLRMNNVGVAPWAVGTVLKVFSKPFEEFGGGFRNRVFDGVTNQVPVMDPASPGLGMLWNLQEFSTNGVITIDGTATNPPILLVTEFQGTNITFAWPESHTGWELQRQTNPLDIGLSTNWGVVSGSTTTNMITMTNWISDGLVLEVYRLAHPEFE